MHAIRVRATGGPEVLEYTELDDDEAAAVNDPGPGHVAVRVDAAGVNFIDTYQRTGLYPMPLPFLLGMEGSGTITALGPDAGGLTLGQRVAWLDVQGSYADHAVLPAARVVPVPDGVGADVAAALMLQGATAHYLVNDTYPLSSDDTCLVHAGAGGVGLLLIQLAKRAGARVITTVGSPEKAELASAAGADDVIDYRADDFVRAVESLVGPHGVDVVYDGIGRTTFLGGLDLLRPRGLMVTFGNASGPVDPISPLVLSQKGSLFLTRPTLGSYVATTDELRRRAEDLFGLAAAGSLDVRIGLQLPLEQAADAHRALEGRTTTGKVLLHP
jgi:NADPH2:quinone reductase